MHTVFFADTLQALDFGILDLDTAEESLKESLNFL